jgi:hypothetical protein
MVVWFFSSFTFLFLHMIFFFVVPTFMTWRRINGKMRGKNLHIHFSEFLQVLIMLVLCVFF